MRNDRSRGHDYEEEPQTQSRDGGFLETWNTARMHISSMTQVVDWPWSGSVRKTIYVDFFIYLVLLVLFCCITLLPTTTSSFDAYKLVQSVQSTLLQEFRPEPEISFSNINELAGLQRWLEGPFMAVFFGYNPNTPVNSDVWTDMTPLPTYIPGFYLASTTVLGPIRLRQLRVGSDSCTVTSRWRPLVQSCFASYDHPGARIRQSDSFMRMWYDYESLERVEEVINATLADAEDIPPSAEQVLARKILLDGFQFNSSTKAGIYRGRLSNLYHEEGFVLDIPEYSEATAREVLRFLRATNWLDAQTRALFLEFSLYLPPSNILLSARLVMEVHETGTIWTDMSLEPINLDVFRTDGHAENALLVAGLVLVCAAMVWDIHSTWRLRQYHARQTSAAYVWVVVGIFLYLAIAAAAVLHVFNMHRTTSLEFAFGEYLPTHRLGYLVTVERGIWAMASFIIWFRLLKFTSQLPVLGILGRTIGRALPQVAAFFLISCVIFLAFAQCFFMAYYATVPGYQSFQASLMSVLRFTVLDFDYAALSAENRVLTPFLFALLLLIVFFVWVNVMVAIISEVYQQECDDALKVQWDEDFPSMSPGAPQPQNDLEAMRLHYPVQSLETEATPKPVALTPDRFFRLRVEKLERFEDLVTVDMHAHFTALTQAGGPDALGPGRPSGAPLLQPSAFMSGEYRGAAVGTWGGPGGDRIFTPGLPRPGGLRGPASSDSLCDDDAAAVGSPWNQDMLEQHRGVYARLGTYSRLKASRAGQWLASASQSSSDDGNPGKPRARPMELQAVYFDREYHNETTARLWWDDHKSFFDTREQLIQYVLVSGRKTLKKVASRLRRSRPSVPRRGSATASASETPAAARRRARSPAPQEYAAAASAAAEAPPTPAGPPGENPALLHYPTEGGRGETAAGGSEPGHATQVFAGAQAFVAQHSSGDGAPDVHPFRQSEEDGGPADRHGRAEAGTGSTRPPQPLI